VIESSDDVGLDASAGPDFVNFGAVFLTPRRRFTGTL